MFWKFHLVSSGLDTLLSKEDVTLKEVLDEEDVLQECKTQNAKLVEFLVKDDVLSDLIDLAINLPPETEDEKSQFKYANLACEVINSDIDAVIEKMATEKDLLDKVWGFLDQPPPLNPLISSFFAKIVATLLGRKGAEIFEYIKEHDSVNKLLAHLEVSAIMEVFIKLLSVVESQEVKMKIEDWFDKQELVEKLVKALHPENSHEKHCNSSNLLSELVRMGRESPNYGEVEEPNRLFLTIEKEDVLAELLDNILSDGSADHAESALVNGMDVLLSLIEFKRPNPEGLEELFTPMNAERIAQGVQSALKAITPRLKDFHKVFVDPPSQSPMLTTVGTLDPPLGKVRLHVAWLISAVVATNTPYVNSELAELGTVNVLLDLFFKYQWNNFLHTFVEHCISSILSNEVSDEDENAKHRLLTHLICDCCLITRIVDAWEDNGSTSKPGCHRKGYMGHLTKIANSVVSNMEKGPNSEVLKSLFSDLPEDVQGSWKDLVEGSLNELNTKNTTQIQISSHMLHSSSEDEDDGIFKSVSILQYESSLQQVQQLSNEFIESFGHNEEELNEITKARNPFDEIGNVDFSINANEETPDAQLFEAVCNEKIHQFDDSGSEEEDIWEERELKYSPKTTMKRRTAESNSEESASSSEESSGSSDDEAVFSDEDKHLSPASKKLETKENKDIEDKMEVDQQADTEWAANFDSDGVAMDTLDAASVGWVDPSATAVVDVKDEGGFADFTDISKISFSDDNPFKESSGPDSPVAMDEDSNDAFKMTETTTRPDEHADFKGVQPEDVKMEEEDTSTVKEEDAEKGEPPQERDDSNKTCESEDKSQASEPDAMKSSDKEDNKQENVLEEDNKSSNPGIKIDVAESGHDPLLVTSKVLGGFVVIDSPQSPTKKDEMVLETRETTTSQDNVLGSPQKEATSPNRSGVSVVTVSSRKVINISSDGKVEMQSAVAPRSPKSPRSKSRKSPESAKSPTLSPSRSPVSQRTELVVERPQANGPVKSQGVEEAGSNQAETNTETSVTDENTNES